MSEVSSKATVSDIGKSFTKKHFHTPSGSNMALESTQPQNRNEYQGNFLGVGVKAASA